MNQQEAGAHAPAGGRAAAAATPLHAGEQWVALLYRLWPSHVIGEVLTKRWMESVIPFTILLLSLTGVALTVPRYFDPTNLSETARLYAEQGLVGLGFAAVLIGGGIDLSVGSVFALVNIVSQVLLMVFGWSVPAVIATSLLLGAATGALNGLLIGVLRLRAFLTTLVTLVIFRSVVDILLLKYGTAISAAEMPESRTWAWLSEGELGRAPSNVVVLVLLAIVCHVLLSRSKPGWHLQAIGGSRRAAHNAGVSVRFTLFCTYVFSGVMVAAAAVFYAARVGNTGVEVGDGLEFAILTGVVLGGVSLGGGRGSVARAMMGTVTLFVITNALVRSGVSGGGNSIAVGALLATAVFIDVKYQKNRHKLIDRVYVSPTYVQLPPPPTRTRARERLRAERPPERAEAIGLDEVDGPEDIILDRQNRTLRRRSPGLILRFSGERYETREVFARIGGRPLGLAFDKDDNLIVCVGGMGVYGVKPDGTIYRCTDETNRSWTINDDSRLRLADDVDIAPDGRSTSARRRSATRCTTGSPTRSRVAGTGASSAAIRTRRRRARSSRTSSSRTASASRTTAVSFFFAETWACRITRYYYAGPKTGTLEVLDRRSARATRTTSTAPRTGRTGSR